VAIATVSKPVAKTAYNGTAKKHANGRKLTLSPFEPDWSPESAPLSSPFVLSPFVAIKT
jgi:hypothetical protein